MQNKVRLNRAAARKIINLQRTRCVYTTKNDNIIQ